MAVDKYNANAFFLLKEKLKEAGWDVRSSNECEHRKALGECPEPECVVRYIMDS